MNLYQSCPHCGHDLCVPISMTIDVLAKGSGTYKTECAFCHKPLIVEAVRTYQIKSIQKGELNEG